MSTVFVNPKKEPKKNDLSFRSRKVGEKSRLRKLNIFKNRKKRNPSRGSSLSCPDPGSVPFYWYSATLIHCSSISLSSSLCFVSCAAATMGIQFCTY